MSEPRTTWAVSAKRRDATVYDNNAGFAVRFTEENHARAFAAALAFSVERLEIELYTTTTEKIGQRDAS